MENEQIIVDVFFDLRGVVAKLGSFTAQLEWDPEVLKYIDSSELYDGFVGSINESKTDSGKIIFNGANSDGEDGRFKMISFVFNTIGALGTQTSLDLEFTAMARSGDFSDLLDYLTIHNGHITVSALTTPHAAFSADPTCGNHPLVVQFTDESESGTGDIIFWNWDFGDGNHSTDQNPLHVYTEPGMFTVTLEVTDDQGLNSADTKTDFIQVKNPTGLDPGSNVPLTFGLSQNYPNPFNADTQINYQLPFTVGVKIAVFDLYGNRITTLVDKTQLPGSYTIRWNALNDYNQALPSGTYVVKMHTSVFSAYKKIILLK